MCAECHSTGRAEGLRRGEPTLRDDLGRDRRLLRGLPRPRLGARRLGARQAAARAADDGLTVRFDERKDVSWSHRRRHRPARAQPAAQHRGRDRDLRPVPRAALADRTSRGGPGAAPRHPPDQPARAGPLLGRRADPGRGLRVRLVPAEPDARAGVTCSDCHDPHALELAGRRQRASARRATTPENYDTPAHHHHAPGSAARALRRLPHARAHLHGGRPAPRPQLPRAAARPHGALRGHQRLHRLPRRPAAGVGGRRGRELARPRAQGLPDLGRGVRRGLAARRPRRGRLLRAVAAAKDTPAIARATALAELWRHLTADALSRGLHAGLANPDPLVRLGGACAAWPGSGRRACGPWRARSSTIRCAAVRIEAASLLAAMPAGPALPRRPRPLRAGGGGLRRRPGAHGRPARGPGQSRLLPRPPRPDHRRPSRPSWAPSS